MLDKHRYYNYLTKTAKSNVFCFTKSLFILYEQTLRLLGMIQILYEDTNLYQFEKRMRQICG
jgi:hypothetical protein